jgi:hypothetical protein
LLFAVLALGVVAPYELIVLAATGATPFGQGSESLSAFLVLALIDSAIVGPLISALYVHAVRRIGAGERPTIGQVALQGVRVLPTVAAAEIIASLGIAAGFLALVIPGVFVLVRWAVVAQAAAIDNENWVEALKRSWSLTRGNWLHVFGLLFLTGLSVAVLRGLGLSATGTHITAITVAVGILIDTLARSFVALSTAVLFFDLVARKSGRS